MANDIETRKELSWLDHATSETFAYASTVAAGYILSYKIYTVYMNLFGAGELSGNFGINQVLQVAVMISSHSLILFFGALIAFHIFFRPMILAFVFSNPFSLIFTFVFIVRFYLEGFNNYTAFSFVIIIISFLVVFGMYLYGRASRPIVSIITFLNNLSETTRLRITPTESRANALLFRPFPSFVINCFFFFFLILPIVGTAIGTIISYDISDSKILSRDGKKYLLVTQSTDQFIFSEIDLDQPNQPKMPQTGGSVLVLSGQLEKLETVHFLSPIKQRNLNPNWQTLNEWWGKVTNRDENPIPD